MSDFDEYIPTPQSRAAVEQHVPCPACGVEVPVDPVSVLRPGDPELQDLFAGSLNTVPCQVCGTEFVVDVPLLFRDDEAGYVVYFMPLKGEDSWRDAEAGMSELTKRVFSEEEGIDAPECRLVVTRSGFVEKIALHTRGLSDRVVEYVKYQFFSHPDAGQRLERKRHRLLYDFSSQSAENLAFIVFDRETGKATAGAHIPMGDYREVADMLLGNDGMREELGALFPGYFVSIDRLA